MPCKLIHIKTNGREPLETPLLHAVGNEDAISARLACEKKQHNLAGVA